MHVEEFRQICLWPLALSRPTPRIDEATADMVADLARKVEGDDWAWECNGLDHIRDEADTQGESEEAPFAYQEFVYFHDFVARFLYAKHERNRLDPGRAMPAFLLFRHRRLDGVTVELGGMNPCTVRLHVARCNLYLFRTGVAILALEVTTKDPHHPEPTLDGLSLDQVLDLSDVFRRTYTPFFDYKPASSSYQPGLVAKAVTWHFTTGPDSGPHAPRPLTAENERLRGRGHGGGEACDPPVASAWAALLPAALSISGDPGAQAADFRARNILDERTAVLSYVRLKGEPNLSDGDNLKRITDAQWTRLCFVDTRGFDLPYDPAFLPDFEARHAYDRFRHWGTRHLFSPYSYVMVTTGNFGRHTLVHHFRRMYFQMGLLAWMEYASYVAFSSRVSVAIEAADKTREGMDGPQFRRDLFQVQRDFLEFVHRFRFTGVSNQLQAGEMYARFREQLGLAPLFADVRAELETATAYLRASDAADQSASAENLNVVAVIGVTLGLAISLLGAMPNLKGWFGDGFDKGAAATTTLLSAAPFAGFALTALAIMGLAGNPLAKGGRPRRSVSLIRGVLVATALIAAIACVFSVAAYYGHERKEMPALPVAAHPEPAR